MSTKRMTKDRAELVLAKLAGFEKLERRNTDQVGWIALHFGGTRLAAARMIDQARQILEADPDKAPNSS